MSFAERKGVSGPPIPVLGGPPLEHFADGWSEPPA
jgi:hypothetical protein